MCISLLRDLIFLLGKNVFPEMVQSIVWFSLLKYL